MRNSITNSLHKAADVLDLLSCKRDRISGHKSASQIFRKINTMCNLGRGDISAQ